MFVINFIYFSCKVEIIIFLEFWGIFRRTQVTPTICQCTSDMTSFNLDPFLNTFIVCGAVNFAI